MIVIFIVPILILAVKTILNKNHRDVLCVEHGQKYLEHRWDNIKPSIKAGKRSARMYNPRTENRRQEENT